MRYYKHKVIHVSKHHVMKVHMGSAGSMCSLPWYYTEAYGRLYTLATQLSEKEPSISIIRATELVQICGQGKKFSWRNQTPDVQLIATHFTD